MFFKVIYNSSADLGFLIILHKFIYDINLVFLSKFEKKEKKKLIYAYNFLLHKLYI